MFRLSLVISLIFITALANKVVGQQEWTLSECINYAIEHNINLQGYEYREMMSVETERQSKRNMLPGIDAYSQAGMSYGRSIDPNTNGYVNNEFFNNSYSLSSSVTLFEGFRIQNNIKYQKYMTQISSYSKVEATDRLAFDAMTAFFDVIYYKGMLQIANEQVEASEIRLKTTSRMADLGLSAKTDLLEMRANLEKEQLYKIQIENALETSVLRLKQLMNYVSADEMVLIEEPQIVSKEEIEKPVELFESYTRWSPQYQSVLAQMNANEKQLAMYRSSFYPSIRASGSMGTGFSETNINEQGDVIAFGDQFRNNRNQAIGASISIPIFNKWANRSNVTLAKLRLEEARNDVEDQKQKMFFELVTDLTELESYYKEYNQFIKRTEVDSLAFQAADRKFEQGLIDINDYYIAKNRLAQTQVDVLRSRTQWEIKKKTIEFYKGQRFWATQYSDNQ